MPRIPQKSTVINRKIQRHLQVLQTETPSSQKNYEKLLAKFERTLRERLGANI
jgi:hypothetical protein